MYVLRPLPLSGVASKSQLSSFLPDQIILEQPNGRDVLSLRDLSRYDPEQSLDKLNQLKAKGVFNNKELFVYQLMIEVNIALHIQDTDKVVALMQQLKVLANKYDLEWLRADSLVELAIENIRAGKLQAAKEQVNKAIKLAEAIHYDALLIKAYNTAGVIANISGDLLQAQSYFHQGVELGKAFPNHIYNAKLLANLGLIYIYLEDWEKALDFIVRGKARYKESKLNEKGLLEVLYINESYIYVSLKQATNARKSLEIAQSYVDKNTSTRLKLIALKSEIDVLRLEGDYQQALVVANQCLNYPNGSLYPLQYGQCLMGRALSNIELGQTHQVIDDLFKAKTLFEQVNAQNFQTHLNKALSEAYDLLGNHQAALEYFRLYSKANKTQLFDRRQSELFQVQQLLETQSLRQKVELATTEKQLADSLLEQQVLRHRVIVVMVLFLVLGIVIIYRHSNRMHVLNVELERLHSQDPLTKLGNRRFFEAYIAGYSDNDRDIRKALAIIDLDNFKGINDTYGHSVGDQVLIESAARLQSVLASTGIIVRWGGEEFVCLLEDDGNVEAVFQHMNQALADSPFKTDAGELTITASIGVSTGLTIWQVKNRLDQKLNLADEALYNAKATGKNRVVLAMP